MGRIDIICSHLPEADVFADIGCDHGYCTQYMLKNRRCRLAYISDISAGSLQKARTLLARETGWTASKSAISSSSQAWAGRRSCAS